jgi:hypothetical protein
MPPVATYRSFPQSRKQTNMANGKGKREKGKGKREKGKRKRNKLKI